MNVKSEYVWPNNREWERMSMSVRRERADALIEQADRQRVPEYDGKQTMAQKRAGNFFEAMNYLCDLPQDNDER